MRSLRARGSRELDDRATDDRSTDDRSTDDRTTAGRSADDRTTRRRKRRRTVYKRTALVVAIVLVPIGYSYVGALMGPGTDSFQARTVEWARDHHLSGVVDRVEQYWYSHHQAPVGGTPNPQNVAPQLAVAVVTTASGVTTTAAPGTPTTAGAVTPSTQPGAAAVDGGATTPATTIPGEPADLVSPASPPVPNEGHYEPFVTSPTGPVGMYVTLIRPDAVHTSSLDAVVWIDPKVLRLRHYPGLKVPGGPWDRPPNVEPDRQHQLIAAFSGGFRMNDASSNGGMLLGGQTLRAMRVGGATLAIDENGVPQVGIWGRDINPEARYDSARQNLDLIVDNSAPVPDLATDPNKKWGFTGPANKSATWRSGVGITATGALVWVGGPGLSVVSLADTLVRAGAIRGMQLEINQEWVQLNTYATNTEGVVHGRQLLAGMAHNGDRWLTPDTRDFVAVFSRS